jgi:hypothetical protein
VNGIGKATENSASGAASLQTVRIAWLPSFRSPIVAAAVYLAAVARVAAGQTSPLPIVVAPSFSAERYLPSRTPIALALSRAPEAEETIAILIGVADLTALFERRGDQWVYRADILPLPSGDTEVVVYLARATAWNELGRFPLRVLTPRGFTRSTISPAVSVNNKGQLAEGRSEGQAPPQRATFQDLQLATGFQSSQLRDDWLFDTRVTAIGVSNRQEALRFGERGHAAPRFDLSDYLVRVQRGPARFALGNVSHGSNRHLMSGFFSRGATFDVASPAVSLGVGALGGSPTVGWNEPLGFTRPSHRVLGSTIAVELRPERPGALHVDLTLMDGSLQPRAGFGQSALTDAQRSRGAGVQFSASSPQQRVRVNGGASESRFLNPRDPLLDGDMPTTQVRPMRKRARYLETSVGVLQNVTVGKLPTTNMTAGWRHERVDPLYRSVAAFTRADILSNALDINATIGPIAVQASHVRAGDNLARVPSLLTTNMRVTTMQAAIPFAMLLRSTNRWIPTASYALSETHQAGAGVPVNAGFSAEMVPDQVSTVHDATLQWHGVSWRASYRFNHSFQDNRQAGRALADLSVATHAASVGFSAFQAFDASLDVSTDRQSNLERAARGTVQRLALMANWRPRAGTGLAATFTTSRNADAPRTEQASNNELRLELSHALALGRSAQQGARAQAFVRYARQSSAAARFLEPDFTRTSTSFAAWSVSSGVNFLVF